MLRNVASAANSMQQKLLNKMSKSSASHLSQRRLLSSSWSRA
jgi:hypothetical protein